MYTVDQILAAAGLAVEAWTKGGVTVRLTKSNQLIGTYAELTRFRSANPEYKGWDVHHIFERQDVERLGLTPFSPPYEQQICVLIPEEAHQHINAPLRHHSPPKWSATAQELESDYRETYQNIENYSGAKSKAGIARELINIYEAVFKNLATAKVAAELALATSALKTFENLIRLEKDWHRQLLLDSEPNALTKAGIIASLTNPALAPALAGAALANSANRRAVIGGALRALNPVRTPALSVWAKAEAEAQAARQALERHNAVNAAKALASGYGFLKKASNEVARWRAGMEVAAKRAELSIEVTAVATAIALIGAYGIEALGATGTAGASTGAQVAAQNGPRIAAGIEEIVKSATLPAEKAAVSLVEGAVEETFSPAVETIGELGVEQAAQKALQLPKP